MIQVAINKSVQIAVLALLLALPAAGANWTNYVDDFSTNQVETDAGLHSIFCESDANPSPEPCLQYHETPDRGLVFLAHNDRPAELGYCLSYDAAQSRRMITGTFTLDVSFPCDPYVSQFPPGELFCATSPDGFVWSQNQPLSAGRQTIPFRSPEGKCYVRFSGDRARIDNVRVSLSSPSATMRVPAGGKIQQAIDAARDGDVIEVAPGTFTGPGNWDLDFRGKRITLRSANGPQSTIILCGPGHRGFYFHQGETSDSVLSGFTIRGGRLTGSDTLGGGIYCEAAGPTLLNCIVDDCVAGLGGGIGCVGGKPTVSGCTITNCEATVAGAGLYFLDSTATVAGCTISGNTTSGSAQGGGAYCTGVSLDVTFTNCIVSDNYAADGAGIFAERFTPWSPQCRVSIVNCTIARNQLTAAGAAGGVDAGDADVAILNSIVWGNKGTAVAPSYAVDVSYSNIQGGYSGPGNIGADPLFADSDYHLSGQSPCIDAGNPDSSFAAEPAPNGGRINMGVWGGTAEAAPGAERAIYHVDIQTGRNWNDGRSQMRPFASIQAAIDAARDGDTILVWPGVYREDITFERKAITVRSAADAAVLSSPGYACSFYGAESSDSVLANFVITGCGEGGIFCDLGASPTLKNLTIVKNPCGLAAYGGSSPTIVNCIIWANTNPASKNVPLFTGVPGYVWKASHSCIDTTSADTVIDWKAGNINVDPLFADLKNGDYHLRSRYGRYVPQTGAWVLDAAASPCIDAGDPSDDPRNEPMGNGNLINMGAYGGTRSASKSSPSPCP